jgi:hypothetical protein
MEKLQDNITGEMVVLPTSVSRSICMDCIFWYQCRRGEIDCHLRQSRPAGAIVKA